MRKLKRYALIGLLWLAVFWTSVTVTSIVINSHTVMNYLPMPHNLTFRDNVNNIAVPPSWGHDYFDTRQLGTDLGNGFSIAITSNRVEVYADYPQRVKILEINYYWGTGRVIYAFYDERGNVLNFDETTYRATSPHTYKVEYNGGIGYLFFEPTSWFGPRLYWMLDEKMKPAGESV
jgi:hypothetical protein